MSEAMYFVITLKSHLTTGNQNNNEKNTKEKKGLCYLSAG